ncbi:penicillin acylase family protein [Virgibacillus halophilus]|uniref:Penicillin acylase family protein n=1 Tax=Tigheibacillus halophilus TaxID=361280 RepID=A0ABU5C472_9BACI|nr:penicillin acylase family protein [Virgibacillus halophilus]
MRKFLSFMLASVLFITLPPFHTSADQTAKNQSKESPHATISDKPTQTFKLDGLKEPAEILVDNWGVPHIYAKSQKDVYFAQGFNAARERLWQIDLWRLRGLGKLSEVLGPEYVDQDRAARLFLYRGDMDKEWEAYGKDTQKNATAFVKGINAYVEKTKENPDLLPQEFQTLGYEPSKWKPKDVAVIRSNGLIKSLNSEVARALTLKEHGKKAENMRKQLEPSHKIKVPKGLNLEDIPEDVLDVYNKAKESVYFDKMDNKIKTESLKELNEQVNDESGLGSNNWVIGPEKSKTGRPILANDPHRSVTVPSLRYMAHLSAPGMDVIGAGEPALPGISIGHNQDIAFGLTIFGHDQEDLYVYKTNPNNPSEYLYKGKWETMKSDTEKIRVKGQKAEKRKLEFTRHGPVIYKDEKNNRAFAVKSAWFEPGTAPYLGSMSYMNAKNWDEFKEAMNKWGSPSENQIYADTKGNIGWKPGGLTPKRKNWDGVMPVPGDGKYEWDGFLNQDKLPNEYNPKRGWIATANQMNLPDDYPYEKYQIGFEWTAPFRYQRIEEVLNNTDTFGIKDSQRLQNDFVSLPARRITNLLKGIKSKDQKVNEALKLLRDWDNNLTTNSSAGALFEVWYQKYLQKAVVASVLPEKAANDIGNGDPVVVLNLLEKPDQRFGKHPKKTRDKILLRSLKDAIGQTESLLGPDMAQWKWGDLHVAYLEHPLSDLTDQEKQKKMNVGPIPRGGSSYTVGATSFDKEFKQTSGASYRQVIDVGNWDNSVAINTPGQSGDPNSKHYDDLFSKWAEGKTFPLLFSRKAVEEATEKRIELVPEKDDSKDLAIKDLKPTQNISLNAGETVKIEFDSKPELNATFAIRIPLTNTLGSTNTIKESSNATELPLMETEPGHYVGYWTAISNVNTKGAEIEVKVADQNGNEKRKTAKGKLEIGDNCSK